MPRSMVFGKPTLDDADGIKALIDGLSKKGLMGSRASDGISSSIRDFFIAKADGKVVGCIAVSLRNGGFAELRSLGVAVDFQGRGIGKRLVELALYESKVMGAKHAVGFTNLDSFFRKFGFRPADKEEVPAFIARKYASCKCPPIIMDLSGIDYVIDYGRMNDIGA